MIPLSNKFPKDYHHILLGVDIDGYLRAMISIHLRRHVLWQCSFHEDDIWEKIEDHLNRLYDPHRRLLK